MTIGSILVQPQKIERVTTMDTDSALVEDFLSLIATLAIDAQQGGQILLATGAAFEATTQRIVLHVTSRFPVAQQSLRTLIEPAIVYVQQLSASVATADSLEAGFALADELLNGLVRLVKSLTLDPLRQQIGTFLTILQNDLGVTSNFIEEQIWGLIDDMIVRLEPVAAQLTAPRLASAQSVICLLRRIKRRFQGAFKFPVLEVEPLAKALLAQVRALDLNNLLQQAVCALAGVSETISTGATLTEFVPFGLDAVVDPGSPPAAPRSAAPRAPSRRAPEVVDKTKYAWYATWLLQYKYRDVPLLTAGDLKNAKSLANKIKNPADAISRFLRNQLKAGEQATIDAYDGTSEASDALKMIMLDLLNRLLRGEGDALSTTLFHSERFPRIEFSDDTREIAESFADDKELILSNRMVLEDALPEELDRLPRGFFGKRFADLVELTKDAALEWPGDRVAVDKEGKRVLLGEKILWTGENVKWNDAPIFNLQTLPAGQRYYIFPNISPGFLETWAFATALIADSVHVVWHAALMEPGFRVGPLLNSGYDLTHGIISLAARKPISGFEFSGHKFLGWAKGMSALLTVIGSAEGIAGDWFSTVFENIGKFSDANEMTSLLRTASLSFMTLLNMGGPIDGPSTLPNNPAENNQEIDGIVALAVKGFGAWLKTLMTESGDKVGLWVLGGIGFGLLAGLTGTIVAEVIAWAEDWGLLGKTMCKSIPKVYLAALL